MTHSKNIKEIILSFNEINLNSGLEIAKLLASKSGTLSILDLNGNKFGEDGKLEIAKILEPVGSALCTMSEDEGSDEEDDEQDEDDNDDDDEEEEEEDVEVVDEDEDYDQVDDYDEEDDEDGEEEYDEDGEEYDEEEDEADVENQFGSLNIVQKEQQPSLFTNFKVDQVKNGTGFGAKPNLFANMVQNNLLLTQIKLFDQFVLDPNITNLKQIDNDTLNSVVQV